MPASDANLSRPSASPWRIVFGAAALALIAAAPATAQPIPRVPVPLRDYFASREAQICGAGGSGPFGRDGCVVPRTDRCPAFRLQIDAQTGVVSTSPLKPGHILLNLDQWERFKRSNPAGK